MSYPDMKNPRSFRSAIDNVYARYASGVDIFPAKRLRIDPERLPRKTQPIAGLLIEAWANIDEDRAYFDRAVSSVYDTLAAKEKDQKGTVVTKIGRNAVNLALIEVGANSEPSITIVPFSRTEFLERFEGQQFGLANGGFATLRNGNIESGSIDGVVMRGANASGVFAATPEDTLSIMTGVSTSPIYAVSTQS